MFYIRYFHLIEKSYYQVYWNSSIQRVVMLPYKNVGKGNIIVVKLIGTLWRCAIKLLDYAFQDKYVISYKPPMI